MQRNKNTKYSMDKTSASMICNGESPNIMSVKALHCTLTATVKIANESTCTLRRTTRSIVRSMQCKRKYIDQKNPTQEKQVRN